MSLSAEQVVQGLQTVTSLMQNLQGVAQSITIVNLPLVLVGQGPIPQIISGLTSVVTTLQAQTAAMSSAKESYDDQASSISDAVRDYVRVSQATLNILIGKAGLSSQVPFVAAPLAAILRQLEASDDGIIYALTDKCPSKASDIRSSADSIDATQAKAVEVYSNN